jgi:hypothetical protein
MARYFSFLGFLLLSILALQSCSRDGKKDIRDFYFPLKPLQDGLVYEYRPVGADSLTPIYWHYRTLIQDGNVFLTGTYYEFDFIPLQFFREEMVGNGMLLEDLYLYETDTTGKQRQVAVEILAGNTFPFEVRDSGGIFLYKIKWTMPSSPGATTTLIKNRRYLGDTVYVFKNQERQAVVFEVKELFEIDDENEGFFEQQFSGREVYAKGIGLVYFRKEIAKGMKIEYALRDRYPLDED